MWSIRNILAILLLVFAIALTVVELNGGFKVLSSSGGDTPQAPVSSVTADDSAQKDKQETEKIATNNVSNVQKPAKESFSFNRNWIYQHRIAVGIVGVLILCALGLFFTKRFFNNL